MAAQVHAATQRGGFFDVEVCPAPVGGKCACADPVASHTTITYSGVPAGEAPAAWQRRHAREALRLVEAAAPAPVPVRALAGLTLAG